MKIRLTFNNMSINYKIGFQLIFYLLLNISCFGQKPELNIGKGQGTIKQFGLDQLFIVKMVNIF